MDRASSASSLERFTGLFPLTGRWLRYALSAACCLVLAAALLWGLFFAEVLPRLASARQVKVERTGGWKVGEKPGSWSRTGAPFRLHLGPVTFRYRYLGRGSRNSAEPVLRLALQAGVFGIPLFLGRIMLPGGSFKRLAGGLGALACVLLFPLAIGCGPMGCRTIQPWHLLFALLFQQYV